MWAGSVVHRAAEFEFLYHAARWWQPGAHLVGVVEISAALPDGPAGAAGDGGMTAFLLPISSCAEITTRQNIGIT